MRRGSGAVCSCEGRNHGVLLRDQYGLDLDEPQPPEPEMGDLWKQPEPEDEEDE